VRVVSLTCSNTEIVCALGCAAELVGVDDHSDYPVEVVTRLPRVGPDLGIDVTRVAALNPDLVLASLTVPGHERVVERLAAAKLPFFAPEPTSLADVYDDIAQIAARLDVSARGVELVQNMRREIGSAAARDTAPRLLVEWWPKPVIVPGRKSWVQDLIERAGGTNPFAARDVKSTPISDDEAVRAAPDAVIMSWCGVRLEKYRAEVVYRRPAWQQIPALVERRVFAVPEAFLGRPGPRLVEGFRALREIVQSIERFSASSI
jgi:iron complex transport system substrate-binding protein